MLHERETGRNSELMRVVVNGSGVAPVLTAMGPRQQWGVIKTVAALEKYLGKQDEWPEALKVLKARD